ncbi:hypothetical protein [Geomonas sp. RF6]|uniref:hypothetical protein n=1 Tax=Geomonas sp. RF6 TaxID=2897342 RepID=UPI003FA5E5DE
MQLATVLHEGAAQSLAVAKMAADSLSRQQLPPEAASAPTDLLEGIDVTIAQLRELMSELSPPDAPGTARREAPIFQNRPYAKILQTIFGMYLLEARPRLPGKS